MFSDAASARLTASARRRTLAVKELDLVVAAAGRKHEAVVRRLHRIDLVLVRDLPGPRNRAVRNDTYYQNVRLWAQRGALPGASWGWSG